MAELALHDQSCSWCADLVVLGGRLLTLHTFLMMECKVGAMN